MRRRSAATSGPLFPASLLLAVCAPAPARMPRSVLARVVQVAGGDTVTAIVERSTRLGTQRENLEEIQRHRRQKTE